LLRDGATRIDNAITDRAGLRADAFATEIRQAARELKPDARRRLLQEAVESGDASMVAALTEGPSFVSGINAEYGQRMREAFVAKHAAAEYAAQSRLSEIASSAARAVALAHGGLRSLADARAVAEIEQCSWVASLAKR